MQNISAYLRCSPEQLRIRLPGKGPDRDAIRTILEGMIDDAVYAVIRNLGGHDLATLRDTFAAIDNTRPTVILAYTIKGFGLPSEGHPQNHSALLTPEQMNVLARSLDADINNPWAKFAPGSAPALLCEMTSRRLRREARTAPVAVLLLR